MTNLRDLLDNFALDVLSDCKDQDLDTTEDLQQIIDVRVDEYIETIKKRLIG